MGPLMGPNRLARLRRQQYWLLCVIVIAVGACSKEQQPRATAPVVTSAPPHRTFTIVDDDTASVPFHVRDLFTRQAYSLEGRRGLLVLRPSVGILDTISTPATRAHPDITMRVIDSSFVNVGLNRPDGRSSYSDLICIANAQLSWAARLPGAIQLPDSLGGDVYNATFMILRSPRAIAGAEIFRASPDSPTIAWRHPFDLRFDDS